MSNFLIYIHIEIIKTRRYRGWILLFLIFFIGFSLTGAHVSNATDREYLYKGECITLEQAEQQIPQKELDKLASSQSYITNCNLIKENKILLAVFYSFQELYGYFILPLIVYSIVSFYTNFEKKNRLFQQTTPIHINLQSFAKTIISLCSIFCLNTIILICSTISSWTFMQAQIQNGRIQGDVKILGSLSIPWGDIWFLGLLQSIAILFFVPTVFLILETLKQIKLGFLAPLILGVYPLIHTLITIESFKNNLFAFGFWMGNFFFYYTDRLNTYSSMPSQFSATGSIILLMLCTLAWILIALNKPKLYKYVLRKFKNNPRIWNLLK